MRQVVTNSIKTGRVIEMSSLFISFSEEKPQESNRRSRPTSNYSLFEVQFGEDASFTEEYGDQDEMFQHIQGTFV